MRYLGLGICLTLSLLGAGCSSGSGTPDQPDGSVPPPAGEMLPCPESVRMRLDDQGTWTVPDVVAAGLVAIEEPDAFDEITQTPPAGTVIEGAAQLAPAQLTIDVTATSGSEQRRCSMMLELIDRSPPTIHVAGLEPKGLVVGEAAHIEVWAEDGVEANPEVTVTLDGISFDPTQPIVGYGHHRLEIRAIDAAGNIAYEAFDFELSPVPRHDAAIVVSQHDCVEEAEGIVGMSTQVLLGAREFATWDADLYTINLWALNEHGLVLNKEPIRVAGSSDPETGDYSPETTLAVYQAGFWQLQFEVGFEQSMLMGCPTRLLITGGGNRGLLGDFDLMGQAPATAVDDPVARLAEQVPLNDDGVRYPADKLIAQLFCRWKGMQTANNEPEAIRRGKGAMSGGYDLDVAFDHPFHSWFSWLALVITDGRIRSYVDVWASAHPLKTSEGGDSDGVRGDGAYEVWLEGPENCGCQPQLTCQIGPSFKARAELDPSAKTTAWGVMDIAIPECELHKTAAGGIQYGLVETTKVKVSAGVAVGKEGPSGQAMIEFELEPLPGDVGHKLVPQGNPKSELKTIEARRATIAYYAQADITGWASAGLTNWHGSAEAEVLEASKNIDITAVCGPLQAEFHW